MVRHMLDDVGFSKGRTTEASRTMSGGFGGDSNSRGGFPMATVRSCVNACALFESTISSRPRLVAGTRSTGSSICSGIGCGAGAAISAAAPGSLLLITYNGRKCGTGLMLWLENWTPRRFQQVPETGTLYNMQSLNGIRVRALVVGACNRNATDWNRSWPPQWQVTHRFTLQHKLEARGDSTHRGP